MLVPGEEIFAAASSVDAENGSSSRGFFFARVSSAWDGEIRFSSPASRSQEWCALQLCRALRMDHSGLDRLSQHPLEWKLRLPW
jgi:hypothetical protein